MKISFVVLVSLLLGLLPVKAGEWIRINQLGYLPKSTKVAVLMNEEPEQIDSFELVDAFTGKVACRFSSADIKSTGTLGRMKCTYRLNFSRFIQEGTYYIKVGTTVHPIFLLMAMCMMAQPIMY
jgi:endoglucanase